MDRDIPLPKWYVGQNVYVTHVFNPADHMQPVLVSMMINTVRTYCANKLRIRPTVQNLRKLRFWSKKLSNDEMGRVTLKQSQFALHMLSARKRLVWTNVQVVGFIQWN